MKPAAIFSLLAAILLASPACERQDYEETKMFNQKSTLKDAHHPAPADGAPKHP
jgi:hypothetical protein